jgi:hypothetical protein
MNEEKNKFVALTARMEGRAVVVRNLGKKINVSEMELVCLCNFAFLGLMQTLSDKIDDEDRTAAIEEIEDMKEQIRTTFANQSADGITRLAQSAAAVLNDQRFEKYLLPRKSE